jgi:hypothetical protein
MCNCKDLTIQQARSRGDAAKSKARIITQEIIHQHLYCGFCPDSFEHLRRYAQSIINSVKYGVFKRDFLMLLFSHSTLLQDPAWQRPNLWLKKQQQ